MLFRSDAADNQVTMAYDLAGRKTSETDPDIGPRQYAYDDAGNLTAEEWGSPWTRRIVTTFDALNRPLTQTFAKSDPAVADTPAVTYAYDQATRGVGLLSSVANATARSEERRVGKECRSRWSPYH